MAFLSDDGGESYNRCHCEFMYMFSCVLSWLLIANCTTAVWSNFEIADMDFWRDEAYSKFFDYLDEKGGFYYEVRLNH